ncbi:MAG: glycosyltransferase [Lachnospiraceae bacterium]|nr:glycosyltransferase [Lachnospiraceae bacterium]
MEYDQLTQFEEINVDVDPKADIDVTVICGTYNQYNYIRKALDSIVTQQANCSFELLIYDDSSTDGTSDIVREFALNYPSIVRAFIAKKNTYSDPLRVEARKEWRRCFVRGKYIATIEGDDYWIDPYKIQKQWRALEKHPECDMCACRASVVHEEDTQEVQEIRPQIGDGIISIENVILGGGQYLATAGLFYRCSMTEKIMEFENVLSLDYVKQIKGALRGGIYYIDDKMVAYRRFAKGSWTSNMMSDKNKLHEQWRKEKRMLTVLDEETGGKYHEAISERMKAYLTFEEQLGERKDELINLLASLRGTVFLWGMGRRGVDFEDFCMSEKITLTGVCDKAYKSDGITTERGNKIFTPEQVLGMADNILASNAVVYQYLKDKFVGNLVNLQEYMPYG